MAYTNSTDYSHERFGSPEKLSVSFSDRRKVVERSIFRPGSMPMKRRDIWWRADCLSCSIRLMRREISGVSYTVCLFCRNCRAAGVADTEPDMTDQDAENLYLFLQRRGMINGEAPHLPPLLTEAIPLEGVDYVTATGAGILSFLKQPGEMVTKGEVIAEVTPPMKNPGKGEKLSITSKTTGVLFARCADRFVRPGKIVVKVAGTEPLEGKGAYLLTF